VSARVGLIHLASGSLGPEPLAAFLRSYAEHDAGVEHDLLVVLNGVATERDAEPFRALLEGHDHGTLMVERRVTDLAAYRGAAEALERPLLCLTNARSVVLAGGWLQRLTGKAALTDVGAAATTGTWESHLTGATTPVPRGDMSALRRAAAEAARIAMLPRYRRAFLPFPNPHLRTNAFAIRRELFLSLEWPEPRSKFAAHALESGREGMTRQLTARGLRCVVVGRDGAEYGPNDWPRSRTFRCGGQENLLVGDRRTEQYERADAVERRRLAELAWGPGVTP